MKISERLNKFVEKLKSWHSGVARNMVRWSPLRAKENRNPLIELTPQRARDLYKLWREGKYADVMLAWDALEEFDETLATVVDKRQKSVSSMDYSISVDAEATGEDAEKRALADAQQGVIAEYFAMLQNLNEALGFLVLASFRGFAHLEVVERGGKIWWMPIDQWLMARTERRGAWYYNADANASCAKLEEVDESRLIIRECARPVDLAAMGAICAKQHAVDGWDGFIDTYGNPAIFFEYPPGTSEERARAYDGVVSEIIGEGRGGFPSGGKITTVETQARGGETFEARADWCNKQIVLRGTGGRLTMLSESGSGTLAGGAHEDTFKEIAAGDGAEISDLINEQVISRLLDKHFPGQKQYAYFMLKYDKEQLREKMETMVKLAGLGYKPTLDVVQEIAGYEVEAIASPVNSENVETRHAASQSEELIVNSEELLLNAAAEREVQAEELEAVEIVRALLSSEVKPERLVMGVWQNYSNVTLDGNSNQLLVRLYFGKEKKVVVFGDDTSERIELSGVNELTGYANRLKAIASPLVNSEKLIVNSEELPLTVAEVAVLEGLAGIVPSEARAGALADKLEETMNEAIGKVVNRNGELRPKGETQHAASLQNGRVNSEERIVNSEKFYASRKMACKGLENGLPKVDTPNTNKRPTAILQRLCNEITDEVEDGEEENGGEEPIFDDFAWLRNSEDDCNAADKRNCRFHKTGKFAAQIGQTGTASSLGLPLLKDMDADKASERINPSLAAEYLKKGVSTKDPLGNKVLFDTKVLEHISRGNPADTEGRLRQLANVIRTTVRPHEIWEDPKNGQRTYLRLFKDSKGQIAMSAFVTADDGKVNSLFPTRKLDDLEDQVRKGILRYAR